jgi:hypothetical protein
VNNRKRTAISVVAPEKSIVPWAWATLVSESARRVRAIARMASMSFRLRLWFRNEGLYVLGNHVLCRLALLLFGLIGGRLDGVVDGDGCAAHGYFLLGFCLVVLGI